MSSVYLVDGARTGFGSFGGSLKDVAPVELGLVTAEAALKKAGIEPTQVQDVVYGNVIHASTNAAYIARHTALKAGVPVEVPALLVNRLCGSGLQAVISSAQQLVSEGNNYALCGGIENMSMSPHATYTQRFSGPKMGTLALEDMLLHTLTDQYIGVPMGITAEALADQYQITRQQQDEFALLSHQRAAAATAAGRLEEEMISVPLGKKGSFCQDERIKEDSSLEQLGSLRASFKKEGTVTAGNASGINDGAVSLILAHEQMIRTSHVKPLARIVNWSVCGVDPGRMGLGPVPAITNVLQKSGLTSEDIDLFEINEAFAVQYLAVEKELQLNREKTNVNGGAIALGHPVGASGSRLLLTLAYELKRRDKRYGIASLCIGGGQGIAMLIENV
ncbi:putative acyltransferase [Fictibacillus macauensis ZFHKF-1]|uniref:acetyl-CoA C-acetyltransferase n=1 Tax=Fictibacillus macauensis ZFHKF-1 TaxID=1196324 RepID=I8J648_9BACL|nr:acetyl-CoA C-acyltransferase [Fictibacillus macauensis]EIT87281.1 putative acyltransferase [Fictibacillus macauensis ZFHKF-1]